MSTNYGKFISSSHSFHQLCSIIYIEDVWVDWIIESVMYDNSLIFDWGYISQKTFKNLIDIMSNK